jgi:hypothetical protein
MRSSRLLIVSASPAAIADAERLGFQGVLENAVEDGIVRGFKYGANSFDQTRRDTVILPDHGIEVQLRRARSSNGKRAWRPVSCAPYRRGATV